MASLEERIRRIEDRTEILELKYAYCRAADLLDADGMCDTFIDDCVVELVPGLILRGRAEFREMLTTYFPHSVSSQHHITNEAVVFESADEAILHTYMYSWQRFKTHPAAADCHRWGRYEDRAVRKAGGWRFTHLRLISAGEYGAPRIAEQFGRPFPAIFE
jgi:ketosteroid isomerase-like protein